MAQRHPRKRLKVSDIVNGADCHQGKKLHRCGSAYAWAIGSMVQSPGPIGPGIVCMSFAVELWFKALGCLSNPFW